MPRRCRSEIIIETSEGQVRSCLCGRYHLRWRNIVLCMTEDEFSRLARLLKISLGRISANQLRPQAIQRDDKQLDNG